MKEVKNSWLLGFFQGVVFFVTELILAPLFIHMENRSLVTSAVVLFSLVFASLFGGMNLLGHFIDYFRTMRRRAAAFPEMWNILADDGLAEITRLPAPGAAMYMNVERALTALSGVRAECPRRNSKIDELTADLDRYKIWHDTAVHLIVINLMALARKMKKTDSPTNATLAEMRRGLIESILLNAKDLGLPSNFWKDVPVEVLMDVVDDMMDKTDFLSNPRFAFFPTALVEHIHRAHRQEKTGEPAPAA